ncbi:MAG: hypothetical protein ACREJC_14570 [Tepidisphaeraceae bacterium]
MTIAYLDTLAPQVRRGEIVARIAELDAMHQRTSTEQSWAELTALQSELKDLDKPATVPTKRDFEGAAAAEFDDPHGIRWGTHSREDYVMIRARELAQE